MPIGGLIIVKMYNLRSRIPDVSFFYFRFYRIAVSASYRICIPYLYPCFIGSLGLSLKDSLCLYLVTAHVTLTPGAQFYRRCLKSVT